MQKTYTVQYRQQAVSRPSIFSLVDRRFPISYIA